MQPILPNKTVRNVFSLVKNSRHFDAPWSVECHWEHLQYLGGPKRGCQFLGARQLVAKLSPRGKSTKRALSPGPGGEHVVLPSFTSFHMCTEKFSGPNSTNWHKWSENLAWPPGFFDASDSHGDRYNNHCPMAWKLAIGFTFNLRNW